MAGEEKDRRKYEVEMKGEEEKRRENRKEVDEQRSGT